MAKKQDDIAHFLKVNRDHYPGAVKTLEWEKVGEEHFPKKGPGKQQKVKGKPPTGENRRKENIKEYLKNKTAWSTT